MDISSPRSLVTQNTGGDWWCVSLCRCFRTAGDEALDLKAPSDPSPPSPPSPRQSDQSPPDAVQVGSWISWTTGSRCFKNLQDCKSCLVLWEVLFFLFNHSCGLWETVGEVPPQRPPVARVAPQREPPKLTVPQALALQSGGPVFHSVSRFSFLDVGQAL